MSGIIIILLLIAHRWEVEKNKELKKTNNHILSNIDRIKEEK